MARWVVAVTGGVASGKSAATAAFQARGIPVADADVAARAVVEPGQPGLDDVVAAFGTGILAGDGRIDRPALRRLVFSDAGAKARLEGLLHPRIRRWLHEACEVAPGPYAVAAIPLLAEGGGRRAYPWLQRILVVDAGVAMQQARLQARDGIDAALAARMVAAQASRGDRLAIADDVVVNDGPLAAVDAAIGRLHERYLRLAASAPA